MGMEKLCKLQLDNNIITKVSGLDTLVNLTWLDLSFNLIEKIEGLDKLTKLEDLTFYKNKITEVQGLDNLHCLNVLSLGKNKISDLAETISYLRSLKNNLQVLRLDNNPFLSEKDHRYNCIAILPGLKYIDYTLIN
jgi:Leucine-rich repeat (LRR) protein